MAKRKLGTSQLKRKIDRSQLKEILALHEKFLRDKNDGKRADLSGLDLRRLNLSRVNLSRADLSHADLTGTNLSHTKLVGADLTHTNLARANLFRADLTAADLTHTNLSDADLSFAELTDADLTDAGLSRANLTGASLVHTDLSSADLSHANLTEACLSSARGLDTAYVNECTAGFHMVPPETGAYIAWKRAYGYLVKLLIPEDALRSSATTRKCRASKATVLGIYTLKGNKARQGLVCSGFDPDFVYRVGETVKVRDFDTDRWNECAPGIHHFLTMAEAVRYIQ